MKSEVTFSCLIQEVMSNSQLLVVSHVEVAKF